MKKLALAFGALLLTCSSAQAYQVNYLDDNTIESITGLKVDGQIYSIDFTFGDLTAENPTGQDEYDIAQYYSFSENTSSLISDTTVASTLADKVASVLYVESYKYALTNDIDWDLGDETLIDVGDTASGTTQAIFLTQSDLAGYLSVGDSVDAGYTGIWQNMGSDLYLFPGTTYTIGAALVTTTSAQGSVNPVPEPSTMLLVSMGMLVLTGARRSRYHQSA